MKTCGAHILFMVLVLGLLSACAAKARMDQLQNTFLEEVDITSKKENLPFEHSWSREGPFRENYTHILIKPVRLDKLGQDAWKSSSSAAIPNKAAFDEAAQEIAAYFHQQILEKMAAQTTQAFTLSDTPGAKTLVMEIALTELQLSHPIARAGALAAPIPGASAALSTVSDPHVSFAARISDGVTGELIATAADRKFPPTRIVDLNKLTATSSAREICGLWADSIAQAVQAKGAIEISEKRFSLLPW